MSSSSGSGTERVPSSATVGGTATVALDGTLSVPDPEEDDILVA